MSRIFCTDAVTLVYLQKESSTPAAYSDADHAGSWKESPYSTSGFAQALFRGAVAWRSRRQRVILASKVEAKNSLNIAPPGIPIMLLTDNQAAECIILTDSARCNKSLTLRSAFTMDTIKKNVVTIKWITGKL